ncbi:hypothetical protein DPEC_G00064450 [Dallia pectoralis]|uniref:Uncharacterized protein n=1 Tax=Dallia pectoralis TaxID=75939 RepID=A0ACC2H7P6_DALPE|nr:hypothetical protein DPEC_G00064450 [Dallia pectoralis]
MSRNKIPIITRTRRSGTLRTRGHTIESPNRQMNLRDPNHCSSTERAAFYKPIGGHLLKEVKVWREVKQCSAELIITETVTPRPLSLSEEQWTGIMLVTGSSPRYRRPAVTVMRQDDLPLGKAVITVALVSAPPAFISLFI